MSSENLNQEIFTLTTILDKLHSSAIPQSDESDIDDTISTSTHLSHLFVPESRITAAASAVFNAQRLDIFVAIDDKRGPREVEEIRSDPTNNVTAEQFAALGHWLENAAKGKSRLTHETYIQYLQRILPLYPMDDKFFLHTDGPEIVLIAYLFCSHKLEQRLVKTRALPQLREGPAMFDVLVTLDGREIGKNFTNSLEDVDVNIPGQNWDREEGLLQYFAHHVPFSASEEHTLSYDSSAQAQLWGTFANSLVSLDSSLHGIREMVETERGDQRLFIDDLCTASVRCKKLAYLLRCKSFHRLLQNPAIVNAVLNSATTNPTHVDMLEKVGGLPRSKTDIDDLSQDELDEDEDNDKRLSAGVTDKSRVLSLILSWLKQCLHLSTALDDPICGRIFEYLRSHGLALHLLNRQLSNVAALPLSDLVQHLTQSAEYKSSKLSDKFLTTEELLVTLCEKVPRIVEGSGSNTTREICVHCQSSLAANMHILNA